MGWLKENGVTTGGGKVAHFQHGRGIQAGRVIDKNEVLFIVPIPLIINFGTVMKSRVGELLQNLRDKISISRQYAVQLFVAHELLNLNASFWAPYFRILQVPSELPYLWRQQFI